MLKIKNLSVSIDDKILLKDINLSINQGDRHLLSGPNGSGKSTLAGVIAGNPLFKITSGEIVFQDKNILNENSTTRALLGIFLGAQNVPEIPGLTVISFLKHSCVAHYRFQTGKDLSTTKFLSDLESARARLNIPKEWLSRSINLGFSGGERKKLMLLRLLMTKPLLAILDEPDSGADIRVQKTIVDIIKEMPDTTFLFISHQENFTQLVSPNKTTSLSAGKLVI